MKVKSNTITANMQGDTMRGVPNTQHILHRKKLNVYEIVKNVNGKNEYFGRYHTLLEAIKWRDYFIENDWNLDLRLIGTPNKNIYFKLGKWRVYKRINGKDYYFGSYDSLEKAEQRVEEIRKKGWINIIKDNERLHETTTSNIVKLPNGKYEIVKTIDGVKETFGVYKNYEICIDEVKKLRKCNWDYDALCESLDETDEGDCFVDNTKKLKIAYSPKSGNDWFWAKHEGLI